MEVVFDNVTYKENASTPLEQVFLRGFTVAIEGSGVYTFLGDSKSGISKLGNLINATSSPFKGKVKVNNFVNNGRYIKNVNKLRMNACIISANPNDMLFNKYVKDELSFGLRYFKYKVRKQGVRVVDALKLVGLGEEYLSKKICDLSINEKKKVAIASSLIFNPDIIVFDEPSMFLSTKDKEELIRLINILKTKYNKMIIITTKDSSFAYNVSDNIYIVNNGSIVSRGSKNLLIDERNLKDNNLEVPGIIEFVNTSNKMGAGLTHTNNILDLIKEVYRNAK